MLMKGNDMSELELCMIEQRIERCKAIELPRKEYIIKCRIQAFVNGVSFGFLAYCGYMIGTFIF